MTIRETLIFKSLSEHIRLRIMILLTSGELCVCDIMLVLSLPQSTTSRHMNILRTAGLVSDRREGKWVFYQIDRSIQESFPELFQFLDRFRGKAIYKKDYENLQKHLTSKICK